MVFGTIGLGDVTYTGYVSVEDNYYIQTFYSKDMGNNAVCSYL